MAQTYTAKGTLSAKASGTTSTLASVSMKGGDSLVVAVAWDTTESANPTVKFGGRELAGRDGVNLNSTWRCRVFKKVIHNTRTADVVITWPSSVTARAATICSLHQAGTSNLGLVTKNTNAAATISSTGALQAPDHINTVHMGFHMTNGPSGDATGTSSTGHTVGQRAGSTGGAATSNVTLQETYKILTASAISAGSFVIGEDYEIKTVGTTDFTAIGAASNTVGVQFTATGVGTGTGDAYHLDDLRSRLTGLTSRDHAGIAFFFKPKHTFTITRMEQRHRNMNHNPDWVEVQVQDENGDGFEFRLDPDLFDDWSDTVVEEYIAKVASIWLANNLDDDLSYEVDTTRDTRMATFEDDKVIL